MRVVSSAIVKSPLGAIESPHENDNESPHTENDSESPHAELT